MQPWTPELLDPWTPGRQSMFDRTTVPQITAPCMHTLERGHRTITANEPVTYTPVV
jgi:hypothetical protein